MGKIGLQKTSLEGVLLITPRVFRDQRGFFIESYNLQDFSEIGITDTFVQDNHSKSEKGVLRGLHYQYPHSQGKLVRVIRGEIYDVVVDIRAGSLTYGNYFGVRLTAESSTMIYVPIGCAHGFLVLKDDTEVIYKVTDIYCPEGESGIPWNDPDIGISWPLHITELENPILSDKDTRYPPFRDLQTPFSFPK